MGTRIMHSVPDHLMFGTTHRDQSMGPTGIAGAAVSESLDCVNCSLPAVGMGMYGSTQSR